MTLPILLVLFFGFLAAGVGAQGYVDMNTAVYLAAASNVTAYADNRTNADGSGADQYADLTFHATVAHDPIVEVETAPGKAFACGVGPNDSYTAGGTVTCRGSAYLRFSKTLLGWVVPFDPEITAQASAVRSPYRSQHP